MATWLDDFLVAIKRIKSNGTLLPARNYLNFASGITITSGPDADTYTVQASNTPSWPGDAAHLLAADGSSVTVGTGLELAAGTLAVTGGATFVAQVDPVHPVAVGGVVFVNGPSGGPLPIVWPADMYSLTSSPPIGIVVQLTNGGTNCVVQTSGIVSVLSGLSPKTVYYAGTNGALIPWSTIVANSAFARAAQPVGVAVSTTSLAMSLPSQTTLLYPATPY